MGIGSLRRRSAHRSVFVDVLVGTEAEDDASFLEVIGSHFHTNLVTGEDVHAVDPHAACQVAEELMILGLWAEDFHQERRVRIRFDDDPDELNDIL